MKELYRYTFQYLKKTVEGFKGQETCCSCPICGIFGGRILIRGDYEFVCVGNFKLIGNIFSLVRKLEKDKIEFSNKEIANYLIKKLKINITFERDIVKILDYYESLNFDLVPVARNEKTPIEIDWVNKNHKDKKEWKEWLDRSINIGLKTGKVSNITVIDIDKHNLCKKFFKEYEIDTLTQITKNGKHLIFKYDKDIPTTNLRNVKKPELGIDVDIKNDGGQIVVYPSVVEENQRTISPKEISEIPLPFKDYLLCKIKERNETNSLVKVNPLHGDLVNISEGSRHSLIFKVACTLKKELNTSQVSYVISVLNNTICNPRLPEKELTNILNSLNKYVNVDEKDLVNKILDYLRKVNYSTKSDVELAVMGNFAKGEDKARIGQALFYLLKEDFIVKRGNFYYILTKGNWKEKFLETSRIIDYVIPYFHDYATIRNGDLIVIGAQSGIGKTSIAINIIKQLVDQKIKPYYASLECGSRFGVISQQLGMKEGDFFWDSYYNPEQIELEKNVITILDWLMPSEYKDTDKIYAHFARQLTKKSGILIIFAQLKRDGCFYAEEMVKFFASVVAKFSYDKEGEGKTSKFITEKIRESKNGRQRISIPCKYNWSLKRLEAV